MSRKKPLAMKENPGVKKLFSDPLVRLNHRENESLCRYGRIFLQLHGTKRAMGGTKSHGSGTPAVSIRK
jgi:hypothetical protein